MSKTVTNAVTSALVAPAASVSAALAAREATMDNVSMMAWNLGVAEAKAHHAVDAAVKMTDNRKTRDVFVFGYLMFYLVRRNYAAAIEAAAKDFPAWKPEVTEGFVTNLMTDGLGVNMLALAEYVFDKGVTLKDGRADVPEGKYRRSELEAKAVKAATERWANIWKTEAKKEGEKAKRKAKAGKAKVDAAKVAKVTIAKLPKAKDTASAVSMAKAAALGLEQFAKNSAAFLPIALKDAIAALASVVRETK